MTLWEAHLADTGSRVEGHPHLIAHQMNLEDFEAASYDEAEATALAAWREKFGVDAQPPDMVQIVPALRQRR
jgi:hypothetical protein